jgi:hypothetical protein
VRRVALTQCLGMSVLISPMGLSLYLGEFSPSTIALSAQPFTRTVIQDTEGDIIGGLTVDSSQVRRVVSTEMDF